MKADKRTCTPPHRFTNLNWLRLCCRVMLAGGLLLGSAVHADEGLLVRLPSPRTSGTVPLESALQQRQSVREFRKARLTLDEVSQLLWAAQGITRTGGRRTAPSAGALYPLEVYLVAGQVEGLATGTYRYDPARHDLSPVQNGDARGQLAKAAMGQSSVRKAPVVLAIAGVYARTAGKYGARAERYVWIEAGHAGQNVYLQAQTLGLGTVMVGAFDDKAGQAALGLPPDHAPLVLMPVGRR